MNAYARSWLSHDGERNQPNDQLLSPFHLQNVFIFVNKPTHQYNFSLSSSFSRLVKEANETTNLRARFFYNTSLYWITNLFNTITFVYWQVFS